MEEKILTCICFISCVLIPGFAVSAKENEYNNNYTESQIEDSLIYLSNNQEKVSKAKNTTRTQEKAKNKESYLFEIGGEAIYFKVIEDGLQYAVSGIVNPPFPTPSPPLPESKSITQKSEYALGFRIKAYAPLYDAWKINGIWTQLNNTFPHTSKSDKSGQLFANLVVPALGYASENATHMSGRWKLNMDVINLEFIRPIQVSRYLLISPLFSIQTFFIHQKLHINYTLLDSFSVPVNALTPQKVLETSRSWGIGPAIGGQVKVRIPENWGIFFEGMFSLMVGKYHAKTKYPNLIDYPPMSTVVLKDEKQRLFTMSQIRGGVSKLFNISKKCALDFQLGWEAQIWTRQRISNWFSTLTIQSNSDITFWGPFASLALNF